MKQLLPRRVRTWTGLLAGFAAAVSVAGCSAGEVELEGKLFDALGVNTGSTRSATPQMRERSALVVPPSLERLPQPGKPVGSQDTVLALINDPDRAKYQDKAQLEAEQARICAEQYEPAKMRGEPDADFITGPLGSCRPSVLSAIGGVNSLFNSGQADPPGQQPQ